MAYYKMSTTKDTETKIYTDVPFLSILGNENSMFLVIFISVLFEVYCVITLRSLTSFYLPD
jgi:hypothetical protein